MISEVHAGWPSATLPILQANVMLERPGRRFRAWERGQVVLYDDELVVVREQPRGIVMRRGRLDLDARVAGNRYLRIETLDGQVVTLRGDVSTVATILSWAREPESN